MIGPGIEGAVTLGARRGGVLVPLLTPFNADMSIATDLYAKNCAACHGADGRADAIAATLAVARNQRTYWRRDPRIRWLKWDDDPTVRLERARLELEQ